jgi:large subunit ribosomal protein L22
MGVKKRTRADNIKEAKKSMYYAKLSNSPIPPRKMRLLAGLVRGKDVNRALDILRSSPQRASQDIEKLLLSAIANWQSKNEGVRIEDTNLFVKTIYVNEGRTLRRLRPAAMGRANIIRKRFNNVFLEIDNYDNINQNSNE